MASKQAVEEALGSLMARIDGNEAAVRSAVPDGKVLSCHVTDLGLAWSTTVSDGRVPAPREAAAGAPADIALHVGSDDLVALVEGRLSFVTAFASGRVRVDAGLGDLLRLRSLL